MTKKVLTIAAACVAIIIGLMLISHGFWFMRGFGYGHRGYGRGYEYRDGGDYRGDYGYRGGHGGGCGGGYYRY